MGQYNQLYAYLNNIQVILKIIVINYNHHHHCKYHHIVILIIIMINEDDHHHQQQQQQQHHEWWPQVQYHSAKKSSSASPRVEGLSREKVKTDMSTRDASRVEALLKDLERDVERRERFLRFIHTASCLLKILHWDYIWLRCLICDWTGSAGEWSVPFQSLRRRWVLFHKYWSSWWRNCYVYKEFFVDFS